MERLLSDTDCGCLGHRTTGLGTCQQGLTWQQEALRHIAPLQWAPFHWSFCNQKCIIMAAWCQDWWKQSAFGSTSRYSSSHYEKRYSTTQSINLHITLTSISARRHSCSVKVCKSAKLYKSLCSIQQQRERLWITVPSQSNLWTTSYSQTQVTRTRELESWLAQAGTPTMTTPWQQRLFLQGFGVFNVVL